MPGWVAKDVCNVLGIGNPREAISRLDDDERNTVGITDGTSPMGGNPNVNIINEPGLYSLIIRSNKPKAKKFKHWITHNVLPAIRKTGGYVADAAGFVESYLYECGQASPDSEIIPLEEKDE